MNRSIPGVETMSSEPKPAFTPGPWWTELDKVFVGVPPNYGLVADADPDGRGGGDGAEPMLSNARLIAAAPELYEALELAERVFTPAYHTTPLEDQARRKMVAALAKARGVSA